MPRPRLWPAALILLLGTLWALTTWLTGDAIRQQRVLQTIATVALVVLALLVWLTFFSRLPRRVRLVAGGVALGLALLAPAFVRVRGVTGDLRPIVELRGTPHAALPEPPRAPEPLAGASPGPAAPPAPVAPAPGLPGAPKRPAARVASAAADPGPAAPASLPAFPQFLGPSRDATLAGPRLARDWSARPPKLLWREPLGDAWSGFAIADGIAVTQEQRGSEERVVAYDARSGRALWSHADLARYATVIAGVGPRATPTIEAGRVFTLGATGILNALELASGRRLWSHDVVRETGALLPEWGKSSSPLVALGRVVVLAGGPGHALVAYDAASGAPAWSAGDGGASYSSATLLTLAGRRQIVVLNATSLSGHDPASGVLLWEHPFPSGQPNVTMPVRLGPDLLLASVGYGVGSKAYRVAERNGALAATLEWESPRLKSKFANLVVRDGFVYGLDDGVLTCLDPARGERRWKSARHGHGQLLLVGELLLVQTEDGELVLVDPSPDAYRELTRFAALDGKTWNPPALAGSLLLVRYDREAAAYELPVE
jgi:outer membrane protein assembly factor BamB